MKMKIFLLPCLLVSCFSILAGQIKPEGIKENNGIQKTIDRQWTFNYFPSEKADEGYESVSFDDSGWPLVSIPHTWNTYETTGVLHPFMSCSSEKDNPYWWIGWGWYRKHFSINKDLSGNKVFIRFDGVQKYCKVWINGKYLGDHKGGYGSFEFDLTGFIRPGTDNVIAVAVSNVQDDKNRIPPMVPWCFDVYGGIYRDVSIVIKNKIYIPLQGVAGHEGGTFITTPEVSQGAGIVRIRTWVKNDDSNVRRCTLQTTITDAEGKELTVLKTDAEINPGQLYEFDQISKPIKRPNLWSPENPYLYSVVSEVMNDKIVADRFVSSFGFRWFHWDYASKTLWLNGKKILLHGGGIVEEYPWLGSAVPEWITTRDVEDLKDNLNYNFLRTAFYPAGKYVYDLADRKGLIIAEEAPSINDQDFNPDVQGQQLKEMIRRDRNHPSIFFWSMGNETGHPADYRVAENEDTTRIIASMVASNGSDVTHASFSEKDFAFSGIQVRAVRGIYNNDSSLRFSSRTSRCIAEDKQVKVLDDSVSRINGNLSAGIYQDFGSGRIFQDAPLLYTDMSGIVDMYRIPKYAYYFWQAAYSVKPVVFIQPHNWLARYSGENADITAISNCEKVQLTIDGVSRGSQTSLEAGHYIFTFKNIPVKKGTLSVTGTRNGSEITSTLRMPGEAAGVGVASSSDTLIADYASIAVITAGVEDENGNQVFGASNALKWSVTGPATFIGPSFYESESGKKASKEGTGYTVMPVSNVIRSTGKPGKIHVTVFSSGLASGSVDIIAVAPDEVNSIFKEPVPDPEGRNKVERPGIVYDRVREQRRAIKYSTTDFDLAIMGLNGYKKSVSDFIMKNNPDIDTASVEYRSLINIMGRQLLNNRGKMIADDYNYNVGHYNVCRIILGYIRSTKLPGLFKEGLRDYYATTVIIQGIEKDPEDEMVWMNWIPSGGTVVYSTDSSNSGYPEGIKTSESTDLSDLIELVYPVYNKFSDVAKERALSFISRMNPYVTQSYNESNGADNDKNGIAYSYKAEKGKPVLIPELKFIAE
jgi:beta-galactosidase